MPSATGLLIVSGDFVRTGGMDIGNYMLARFLAGSGWEVHLVAHRVADELARLPRVHFHRVPIPFNAYLFGLPLLDHYGRYWAGRIARGGGRVVVNGGNCQWDDVNWVHYVHAAYTPEIRGGWVRRLKTWWQHHHFRSDERRALTAARLVIANSYATKRELISRFGLSDERIKVIYYGTDGDKLHPLTAEERRAARAKLAWGAGRLKAVFVGALGDRRKGFDLLIAAWQQLCGDPSWDVDLTVVGIGAELPRWQAQVAEDPRLRGRVEFLGFRRDVPQVLGASDLLVAPTRYEAYGLGVHEALCCGVPALVSADAGVAERYPAELQNLLLPLPLSVAALAAYLRTWREQRESLVPALNRLASQLGAQTWEDAAAGIVGAMSASHSLLVRS